MRLQFEDQLSLAGCNNGLIASELATVLHPSDNPPIGWTIPIASKWNEQGSSVIIDIKPNSDEVFLCELDRVFGYSFAGWTPIMFRLKLLYSDIGNDEVNKNDFIYPTEESIVYTMLYLYGSIRDGSIHGTWRFPGPSPTNSLLFWPEAMTFFHEQVKVYDPHFLTEKTKAIHSFNELSIKNK